MHCPGSSNSSMPSSDALRSLHMVGTDCPAATACLVHNGQARRSVFVEFATGIFKRLIHAATYGRGTHNCFNRNFRSPTIMRRHTVAQVAFGHDAEQAAAFFILNHGRAPASCLMHRLRGALRGIVRRATRIHRNWLHLLATTTHIVFLLLVYTTTSPIERSSRL